MRKFPKYCGACRERTMSLLPIDYSVQVDLDGQKFRVNVPGLIVPKCSKCGEFYLDQEADEKITAAFRIQAGLMTPAEISNGREGLGLTQQSLADLIRVPVESVDLWEKGMQIQTASNDQFLRAIFSSPSVRNLIMSNWKSEDVVLPPRTARPGRELVI